MLELELGTSERYDGFVVAIGSLKALLLSPRLREGDAKVHSRSTASSDSQRSLQAVGVWRRKYVLILVVARGVGLKKNCVLMEDF